jgi:hypothetical protein
MSKLKTGLTKSALLIALFSSIDLFCTQTLVQDINGEFAIFLRACPYDAVQPCAHALEVFVQNEQFTFEKRNNRVSFTSPKKAYPIPVQLSGIKVTRSGNNIVISLDAWDTVITWDTYVMNGLTFGVSKFLCGLYVSENGFHRCICHLVE